jgi:two-component system cell cycle sensor histidine kinase/response regulator CckA
VVHGDRATLSQVLMNLLTNASDALGDRAGMIGVCTRRVSEVDARWDSAVGATVRPGDWVLIEVKDSGDGMDEATRGRVFEPFFSTKERGHGLGLAACLGIVSAHGGAVLVESQLGQGSCFSVLLPASRVEHQAAVRPAAARVAQPCKVLIVDDEGVVRAQLRRSLELRGYSYLDVSVELRLPRGEFQGFLAKPYGASDLAAAMEHALAQKHRTV